MSLARKLEQRLERLVDGLSSAIFRGGMPPAELAGRLVRQADLLVTEETVGPTIPNRYIVKVNPRDLPEVEKTSLDRELTAALAETAAERGWRTGGPIAVRVEADDNVGSGSISCDASTQPGRQTPWARLVSPGGQTQFAIDDNRTLVGRSSQADVVLEQPEVSRLHAVIFRQAGGVWVVDLGSANGTFCAGTEVGSEPVAARTGDILQFGPATFALRLV